jgi:diadenosine tetraphosphate (Ap4A) HIT family hydrolase
MKLNRHEVDLFDLKEHERNELFEKIVPELKRIIGELFRPDLYNHAFLGNDCRHLHLHLIPRYSSSREFAGKTFRDGNWNSHYKPYPSDFETEKETFNKIKEEIGEKLE